MIYQYKGSQTNNLVDWPLILGISFYYVFVDCIPETEGKDAWVCGESMASTLLLADHYKEQMI